MMATIGNPKTRAQNIRPHTVKPRFTDTRLIRTSHYCGQFALSLGKESPYIFTIKFQPTLIYNTDTFYAPLVSVLSGFHRIPAIHSSSFPCLARSNLGGRIINEVKTLMQLDGNHSC